MIPQPEECISPNQKAAPSGAPFFDKRVFAPTRAFSRIKCVKTHSLRAKYFSRRTRRREKWIKPYSRPAGRELCEAFLTG